MTDYLHAIYDLIAPLNSALIWQTDGRPMSGDIGDGTTLAAVKLGQKVLAAKLPGYVQLAGGTNSYTVAKLRAMGLLNSAEFRVLSAERDFNTQDSGLRTQHYIAGIAYGSYARVLLSQILEQLENKEVNNTSVQATIRLEEDNVLLWQAVGLAHSLVSQLKSQQER